MGTKFTDPVQVFWDDLLSRQKKRILKAFQTLDEPTRQAVWLHLQRMATEEGWHPEQAASARKAIKAISDFGLRISE